MIITKEQTVLESIKDTFERQNMQTQYYLLGYITSLFSWLQAYNRN